MSGHYLYLTSNYKLLTDKPDYRYVANFIRVLVGTRRRKKTQTRVTRFSGIVYGYTQAGAELGYSSQARVLESSSGTQARVKFEYSGMRKKKHQKLHW